MTGASFDAVRGTSGVLRLRAEPRRGVLGAPDGLGADGLAIRRPIRAIRAGASASAPTADAVVPGLYVADGSLFPTGIGVNPMITIMALARQVSRTVLAEA